MRNALLGMNKARQLYVDATFNVDIITLPFAICYLLFNYPTYKKVGFSSTWESSYI